MQSRDAFQLDLCSESFGARGAAPDTFVSSAPSIQFCEGAIDPFPESRKLSYLHMRRSGSISAFLLELTLAVSPRATTIQLELCHRIPPAILPLQRRLP